MIRPFHFLCLTVSALALLPGFAHAQNYVRADAFTGPNVVIDFGALDQARGGSNQWAVAPVVKEESLPMPAPAPKLTPPVPKQAMGMTPLTATPQNIAPSINPSLGQGAQQAGIKPMPPRPATTAPVADALPMPSTELQDTPVPVMAKSASPQVAAGIPPQDNFSARDMLDAAPAGPLPVVKKPTTAFNSDSGNIRTRAMLAEARNDSKDQHGRINLASISSAPPVAPRDEAPLAAIDSSANGYKPSVAAKPTLAAPAPIAKPSAPVKPAPVAAPKAAPKIAAKPVIEQAPILPPQKDVPMPSQRDLATLDEDLPPIVTRDKTPPKPVAAKEKTNTTKSDDNAPMQIASLPLPDTKSKTSSSAGQHFTLNFAKDSGNLDGASKSELDKIAKALQQDSNLRAQVRAYASGTPETSGQARRLSLTRALAARTYVLDKNIPATRLDIRALGNGQGSMDKPTSGSLDKVEITLIK